MNRPLPMPPSLLVLLALPLAGCGHAPPPAPPLAGAAIGGPFSLTDQNGDEVTNRDFAGKYRIMYFGYTYCPDICPVDMQNIGGGMKLLRERRPDLAKRIVPIFVSVDPARDTPSAVKQFVSAFGPGIVGLTGSPAAIRKTAKEYAIFYQKQPADAGGDYLVNHSQTTYLMGPNGDPIALVPADRSPQAVDDTLTEWVK